MLLDGLMYAAMDRRRSPSPFRDKARPTALPQHLAADCSVTSALLTHIMTPLAEHGHFDRTDKVLTRQLTHEKELREKAQTGEDAGLVKRKDHHWGQMELVPGDDGRPSVQPSVREECASAVLPNALFIFGGIGTRRSSELWRLNLRELRWKKVINADGPTPPPRSGGSMTAVTLPSNLEVAKAKVYPKPAADPRS